MNARKVLLVVFLFINVITYSQIQGGGGLNVGYKNTGVELQGFTLNRIKVFAGFNLNRFDSYSSKFGVGIGVYQLEKKHNFWISSSAEYKFAKTTILEKNDVFYRYHTNNLNYWNFGGAYSLRIDNNIDKESFLLLEVDLFYKQLLNQLNIEPSVDNTLQSIEFENDIRKYFKSGLGISVGIKFVW